MILSPLIINDEIKYEKQLNYFLKNRPFKRISCPLTHIVIVRYEEMKSNEKNKSRFILYRGVVIGRRDVFWGNTSCSAEAWFKKRVAAGRL